MKYFQFVRIKLNKPVAGDQVSATRLGVLSPRRGVFGQEVGNRSVAIRLTDITDGLSNTIAMSERCFRNGPRAVLGNIVDNEGAPLATNPSICLATTNGNGMYLPNLTLDGYLAGVRFNDGMAQFTGFSTRLIRVRLLRVVDHNGVYRNLCSTQSQPKLLLNGRKN